MIRISTIKKVGLYTFLLACSILKANSGSAQLIVYTNDTGGVLNSIGTHVTADTLKRVNSASRLSTPCTHGFSTKGFTNNTVFFDTMAAVQVKIAPTSGYRLKIDTFIADLRHSPTGPAKARFAYSLNNGTSWIPQSVDQLPFASGTCDSMTTCKWTTPVTVSYPGNLLFRVYGYNASVTTGTGNLQILNLVINGSALSTLTATEVAVGDNELNVFPNPTNASSDISYHLFGKESVSLVVCNVIGQVVASFAKGEEQAAGAHSFSFNTTNPGIYYVKLVVGNKSQVKKLIRL